MPSGLGCQILGSHLVLNSFSIGIDEPQAQAQALVLSFTFPKVGESWCSAVTGLTDHILFQEVEDFFEQEKTFLVNYYNRIKDACAKADKMTRSHKSESFQSPFKRSYSFADFSLKTLSCSCRCCR